MSSSAAAETAEERPSSDSSKSQPTYPQVICSVAVAQICLTVGYSGGHTAALRALTDIATRYIRFLADASASVAATRGRTQGNILDLTVALEFAAGNRGFAGASDVTRAILRSSVLGELRAFVACTDEIPFPKPIPRRKEGDAERKTTRSFAQAGREPGMRHVPKWLPCFPEGCGNGGDGASDNDVEKMIEQKETPVMATAVSGRDVPRERGRVRFRLGFGGEKRGGKKKKKIGFRKLFAMSDDVEVEIAALKNSCRRRVSNPDNFCKTYAELASFEP